MEIGNYVNLFPVSFSTSSFTLSKIDRGKYPVLLELRARLQQCQVYAFRDTIYGFGPDFSELTSLGFRETTVGSEEVPQLTNAIVKDGISRHAVSLGYDLEYGFTNRVFDRHNPLPTKMNEANLFKGFEFRSVYLLDPTSEKLFFSLLLDLRYKLELKGRAASYSAVFNFAENNYGEAMAHEIIRDIRIRTGDLTMAGGKNPEASRFRFSNILDFVKELGEITLYDNSSAKASAEPIRIAGAY